MKGVAGHAILPEGGLATPLAQGGGSATPRPTSLGVAELPLGKMGWLATPIGWLGLTLVNGSYQKIDVREFIFIFMDSGSKFSNKKT